MSILVSLDGVTYDMETTDNKQGLFVLLDRLKKDQPKGILMINESPVMITEYISDEVYPEQEVPEVAFNEQLGVVVQVIHTQALSRLLHEFRNTDFTIKVAEIKSDQITDSNTIKLDMKILKSAMKKLMG